MAPCVAPSLAQSFMKDGLKRQKRPRLWPPRGASLAPCHEWGAVGPMCGIISPSMPLVVVENRALGNTAYAPFMESGGATTLRFGAFGADVTTGLKWIERVLAPALKTAVHRMDGGLRLKPIIAQALHMGDDVHNRNTAASLLLFRAVARSLVRTEASELPVAGVLNLLGSDDMFFLPSPWRRARRPWMRRRKFRSPAW